MNAAEAVAQWDDFSMYTPEGGAVVARQVIAAISRTWPLGTGISEVVLWVQEQVCIEGKALGIKYGASEVHDTDVRECLHSCIESIIK